jgi:hypothetical protein
VFRQHWNESFSSLRIEDFKNFLRFRIGSNGDLTIYPIGLVSIPRHWRPTTPEERASGAVSRSMPTDGDPPFLIERKPVVVRRGAAPVTLQSATDGETRRV